MAHGTLETAQTLFMQCYLSQMQSFEKSRTISENSCWIHHVFLVPINQLRYMFFWGEMMWNIRGYWKLLLNDGEVYNLSELPPHTSVYCARILYRLRFFFMSLGTGYRIPAKYGASMLYAYSTLGGCANGWTPAPFTFWLTMGIWDLRDRHCKSTSTSSTGDSTVGAQWPAYGGPRKNKTWSYFLFCIYIYVLMYD
jgi:hypothetical protein